jgi:class 3 adenylate cyclase
MDESFVTIVFTDLVGSASLFERHGDEAADAIRREHFEALRSAVAEHGGREVKSTGDGLMVAFPSAVAAVRCAADMQRATAAADRELELRVGIEAGEPLVEGDDLYGTPVIVASRLCDLAGAGEILASEVVCRIAGPRVSELIQPVSALPPRRCAGGTVWARNRSIANCQRLRARSASSWPTTTSSCARAFA